LHSITKYPVRTIRHTQRRQSFCIQSQNVPSEPSNTYTGVNHVHARTKEPVRTIRYGHRRQSFTLKNEIARPNHQKKTPASMVVPLKTNTRVTAIKNHAGGQCCFSHAAQHGLQATPLARPHTCRVFHAYHVPPAVAFKEVASGALEAQRWAAEKGHASFHGSANENQTQILYTHARNSPSEPSERDRGVNRFTPEYEIARPNH